MSPVLRRGIVYSLTVFAAVRIGLALLGWMGATLIPDRGAVSVPGWPDDTNTRGAHNLVTAFEEQDALWYLRIADAGYRNDDVSAAFFPAYPVAVGIVSWALGGRPLAAGLLVSNLSFLGALVGLYALTTREFSEGVARKTVLYLALFPTSFFFMAPYGEPLYLLLVVLAFLAARRARWPAAGLLGAAASATRALGASLAPALAVEAIHRFFERRRHDPAAGRRLVWALLWSAVAVAGLVAYLWFWAARTGDALVPMRLQSNWSRAATFPGTTLVSATTSAFGDGGFPLLDWLVTAPVVAGAVWVAVRCRPSYTVYTWIGLLVPLSFAWAARPLMSVPRFVLVLFPAFWAIADLADRRRLPHTAVVAVFAAGLSLLSLLFVNSWFIF